MKVKESFLLFLLLAISITCGYAFYYSGLLPTKEIGEEVDKYKGVAVYYNGGVGNVSGRNLTADNYNLGLKYQCVEFVKRFYFEHLNHKMPNSYAHAKDFFDPNLEDGHFNTQRGLIQYRNFGTSKPEPNDLIVFKAGFFNKYGQVA